MYKTYENTKSTSSLLEEIYIKMEQKINILISFLSKKEKMSLKERQEYERIKKNMIEVFQTLSLETNDEKLIDTYNFLSMLLTTNDIESFQKVKDFCIKTRK